MIPWMAFALHGTINGTEAQDQAMRALAAAHAPGG
jgi:hypothetical protein